jgi:hypothetical protein
MRRRTKAAKLTKYMQENPNAPVAELIEKFKASKQSIYNTRYKIRKQHRQENTITLTATQVLIAEKLGLTAEQYARQLAALSRPKIRLASAVTSNTSIHDVVNHPAHYTDGGIETIDFIEAKRLGYHLGNVVKYICRAGKKGTNMGLQDLQKARWYLDRAIEKNEINPPTR